MGYYISSLLSIWCLFHECFRPQRVNVNKKKYIKQAMFLVKKKRKGKPFRQGKTLGPVKSEAETLLLQVLELATSFPFQGKKKFSINVSK